jgi:group II intron reverse transcriptase/maturase
MILNAIYEADFLPVSYGYRPEIGPQDAHQDLGAELQHGIYGYVVEADIKGFFDQLDHQWLLRMLAERIADRRLIDLIKKWLKAGILDITGMMLHPSTGTPQGGIVSPILANIYLHYALDLWFVKVLKRQCRGRCFLLRYADDFVAGFQFKADAQAFYRLLPERLAKFHLAVEPSKTGIHEFSRHCLSRPDRECGAFDFLGFTFRWKRNRSGKPHVSRQTSSKKYKRSLQAFTEWIKKARYWPRRMLFASLKRKLAGYVNYYGVPGNSFKLHAMWYDVYLLCFKWLNRCSQRRSYTMAGLTQAFRSYGIGSPQIAPSTRNSSKHFLWTIA